MRKRIRSAVMFVSLPFLAAPALAAGSFDGINAQVGVGFSSLHADNYWNDYGRYKHGQMGHLGQASLGYSHAFENSINLGASLFTHLGDNKAGIIDNLGGDAGQYRLKNVYGLTLEPGYYVADDTLGYLKLGYAFASSRYENPGDNTNYGRTHGFQYGLGVKHLVTDHLYMGAEAYQIDFSKKTSRSAGGEMNNNAPSMNYAGVILGYNFGGSDVAPRSSSFTSNTAFDGFNVQLGAGVASLNSNSNYSGDIYRMGETGAMGMVSLGYSQGIKDRFNLAASLFHHAGSDDAGAIDYIPSYSDHLDHWKLDKIWGISLEPGYYLSDHTLAYLKLGYANARATYEGSYLSHPTQNGRSHGLLYGVGFKQLVSDNIYVGAEAYQILFEDKSWPANGIDPAARNKPSMNYVGAMVGYRF